MDKNRAVYIVTLVKLVVTHNILTGNVTKYGLDKRAGKWTANSLNGWGPG